ncbi:methyl-accepting chemotaxis protein [Sphingomonas sp. LaA6.9]|uniref:methyl-accepting chemotaxis protein n=1 Tax=Sphingomonas sp. LaA6.9 TaxID=2919914 RepID=UPI001F5019E3|nr:methyl-accepting chemotaxis protein [Sphingomonas sp. LaA6.9]MCJ8158967.1 methyl-accepting chemotaxis protein [Sphingomonas sp. LaA6.9]
MTTFKSMKIATKVAALLGMLGLLTLGIALLSHRTLGQVDQGYTSLIVNSLPANTDLSRANRRATDLVYIGYRALSYDGNSEKGRAAPELLQKSYERGLKNLEDAKESDPSLADAIASLRQRYDGVHDTTRQAVGLSTQNRKAEAAQLLARADDELEAMNSALGDLTIDRVKQSDADTAALQAQAASMSTWMLVISLIGVAGGLAVAILVARAAIVAPLARLQDAMRSLSQGNNRIAVPGTERADEVGDMAKAVEVFRDAAVAQEQAAAEKARADADQKFVVDTVSERLANVAEGDLTAEIRVEFPQNYAELRANFNSALTNLRDLIGAVTESAQTLRTGSGEIAHASEDLARRTESNAASLEETSAALAQIDERIKATAKAAGVTVTRADEAITTVSGGRSVADEAVQAMGRVRQSAKGIDEVIEGVDKIAFQTRVLAMNAAVEAGRAGDAGRGFAVVADLVSALAMRAEEEAKRARDQLTVTQSDIVSAVDAVQKIDGALTEISAGVGEVHDLLGRMATDNQAQASAITQISVAVMSMDQSTQQNAAMVEETSAAARNLSVETVALTEKAGQFRIGDRATATRVAARIVKKDDASATAIRTLPVAAMAKANAAAGRTAAARGDWQDF